MKYEKCPKCKKKIVVGAQECSFCGELIFRDPIEVTIKDDEDKTPKDKKVEDKKEKAIENVDNDNKKIKNNIFLKAIRMLKNTYTSLWNKFKKSKIYLYMTYQNILCIITAICTIAMVSMGIKVAKYTDNNAVVKKIDENTTYSEVEKMEEQEVKKKLDLKRGILILEYENQQFAGVDVTLSYETNMKTEKILQTIITFPYNKKDVAAMKKYLEVNYGHGKVMEDKTIVYNNKKVKYSFTNGAFYNNRDTVERVEIVPLD